MIIKNKTERKNSILSKILFNKKILFTASALLMLTIFIIGKSSIFNSMLAGTITGTVFQDFNANGTLDTAASAAVPSVDTGVAGITVTAYDSSGTARGTATTSSTGAYSLSATGTGPYRIEFTNLPAGYQPSARSTDSVDGGTTTNSGSTVQFVPNGNTANVNLAINRPDDFCQNNPLVCVPQHYQGNVDGGALRTFPYNYTSDLDGNINTSTTASPSRATTELIPSNIGQNDSIGTVYGVAWNRATRNLYASAYIKRVAKLGALSGESPGAIYVRSNPNSPNSVPALYVNLNTVFTGNPAGTNPHPIATTDWTSATADSNTSQFVGKSGLGDLEISQDGSTLYSVNLNDRQLYLIPTSGTLNSTTITRFPIPTTGLTTNGGTCPTADVRPFALGRDASGQIYVGGVCSGETITGTDAVKRSYLHAFIWRFNPGGTFTLVANRTLNYSRPNAGANDVWLVGDHANRPELILTDIEFDRGDMIVGFRDKNGDETPTGAADRGYGEILRATSNGSGGWTFESNPTTQATEYYKDLNGDNRDEGVQGALLQLPGFNHTMITAYDAVTYNGAGTRISNFYTNGVQRYNNTTGAMTGAYDIFLAAETNTFRKANGLGDIEALCDSAPIEIGNRVWNDANGNGVQDPGEAGIAGVTVELYNGATPVTYARYRDEFDNIAYNGTNGSTNWSGSPWAEVSDDGVVTTGDVQVIAAGTGLGNVARFGGTVTGAGGNGIARAISLTGSSSATLTFDYYRTAQGLRVEYSTDNGANYTTLQNIASGTDATVQSGSLTLPVNATNIRFRTNTAGATNYVYVDNVQISTNAVTTTDASGEYYFSSATGPTTGANATFNTNIQPNTAYQIRFSGTPLSTLIPTAPNATTNSGNDSNDSEVVTSGALRVIDFTTGGAGENDHTLDAGFTTPVSIGSTVFNDVNNNGIFDAGETGIGGVLVELLYDSNNDGVINGAELTTPIATITTTSTGTIGNYFFNGLTPGNYQVRIPTPPATATLSSTVTTTTDNQVDNDDNGIQTGGAGGSTISPLINLAPGAEPLNAVETGQGGTLDDASGDSSGDMTIDFGFLAPASVGNFVFIDTNRNGIQDAGEVGLNGVTVTLYNSAGTAIATTMTTTVGGNAGQYSFTGLPPGTYSVGFTRPFGYGFSPQNAPGSTAANDSDPNILTGRTANFTLVAGQNNVDIDAGVFLSVAVGNRVWVDANNNGLYDAGETFFSGATVNLYLDANDDGVPDGAAIRTTTTDTNGLYLFDGLAPNNYIIGVVTPTNYVRSSVNGGDPDNNIDNDNNGATVSGNETRSLPVTLSLGAEPTGENPNDTTTTADNSGNLTVDFGFTRSYSIGNRVWFDTNNNGQINAAEVGISGVSVSLLASTDLTTALQTTTTDASGYYRFDNVVAGSYVIRINPSNFASGGALAGYQNTTGNTAANVDSTATLAGEDGINPTGAANTVLTNGILSNVKTIAANSTAEPTGETDVQTSGQGSADNQSNMTIDFGFYRLSLSGTVWSDTSAGGNNNGILDAGEAGISNVVVFLYDSTGAQVPVGPDGILGTADDTVGGMVTDASGNYSFQGLPPGNYRVGINTARTGTPSTPNQPNADNRVDNDNNGTVNASFPQRIVSNLFSLVAGGEPSVTQATGTSLNTTVDFGFIIAPTLVTLDTFEVLSDGSATTIRWETASEDANLGFNVYREANGKRELLNSSPIIGTALRSKVNLETKNSGYSWTDVEPVENAVYYLEDIDLKGTRTIHGPVTPLMQDSRIERQTNPKMLSDLRKLAKLAKQTDSVSGNETAAKASVNKAAVNPRNSQRQFEIAARDGVKIAVQRDGWYRITLAELQSAGFNLNSDPNNWQLFADGEEIPFRFGAENAVEFYGHGLDLLETDKQTYYLIVGKSAGQRLPEEQATEVPQRNDAGSFRNTAAIKDRSIYVPGVFNGDESNWFGALVYQGESAGYDLAVNDRYGDGQAHLTVKLQGLSDLGHIVNLRFNNLDLGVLNFANFDNQSFEFDLPMSSILEGNNRISLIGAGNEDDLISVDEVSLTYERRFTAHDNKLSFRVPAGNTVQVGGFGDKNINVVEVNNDRAVRRVAVQSEQTQNGFAFGLNAANYDREFIAFTGSQTNEPSSIVYNAPSRWNSGKNRGQFVIIAPERFRTMAENLASVRREEGFETQVVTIEDIYDEFSFGAASVASLKEFLRTAAQTWQVAPKYVLLLGDSSYDMRNYLAQPDRNLIPTKLVDTSLLETSSDSWIADFDNDGIEDIAIGRLPAGTEAEATRMIGKVTRPRDTVREQKTDLFVADSGFDADADELRAMLRSNVSSNVIRRSALDVPQMRSEIIAQTDSGQSVITYLGHGSSIAWSSSGFFRKTDTVGLKNDRLSFYLLMTCLNGYTIDPGSDSLSEALMKSENGAYAVWVSSGATRIYGQTDISRAATDLIFNRPNDPLRIGDIARLAKTATQDVEIRQTWQLLGDPTMFVK